MTRQIIVMFCSLFCFVLGPSWAAEPGPAPNRGALFKVQKDGRALYLFGTIHVGSKDFYPLEPRVAGVLKKAPVLALEIDPLGDPKKLALAVQKYGMVRADSGNGNVTPPMTPEWRARLDRLLKQYNIEPAAVAPMKPWLLASVLTVSEFASQGYDAELAVDAHLAKQAHASGQKIVELETPEGQMGLFGNLPAAEQQLFLQETIVGIEDKEQAKQAREIADAWRTADVKALDALAAQAEQDETFSGRFVRKVLLEGRNPSLADSMAKLMARENNSLAAIGILHLVGKGSVPELLRQRGMTVERIY